MERGPRGTKEDREGNEKQKELRCVMHVYRVPMMNVITYAMQTCTNIKKIKQMGGKPQAERKRP